MVCPIIHHLGSTILLPLTQTGNNVWPPPSECGIIWNSQLFQCSMQEFDHSWHLIIDSSRFHNATSPTKQTVCCFLMLATGSRSFVFEKERAISRNGLVSLNTKVHDVLTMLSPMKPGKFNRITGTFVFYHTSHHLSWSLSTAAIPWDLTIIMNSSPTSLAWGLL